MRRGVLQEELRRIGAEVKRLKEEAVKLLREWRLASGVENFEDLPAKRRKVRVARAGGRGGGRGRHFALGLHRGEPTVQNLF